MIFSLEPRAGLPLPVAASAVLIALLGFVVGMVSAAFGIGGGFVITPFCHAVLGLPAPLAVATSMGQIPLLSVAGVRRYQRDQVIDYGLAGALLIGALPAAQLVAWWLAARPASAWPELIAGQTLPDLLLLGVFTLAIGGLGLYNMRRAGEETDAAPRERRRPLGKVALLGIVFGALSALLGIGGGFFAVPIFIYLCGLRPVEAVATSLFAVLITSAVTTLHYLWLGQIYFAISLIIASGSMLGARVGAGLALRSQPATLLRSLGAAQVLICLGYLALKLS